MRGLLVALFIGLYPQPAIADPPHAHEGRQPAVVERDAKTDADPGIESVPIENQPIAEVPEQTADSDRDETKAAEERDASFWEDKKGEAKTYEAICSGPQSTEHADLCQQWRMAQEVAKQVDIAQSQLWATYIEIGALVATIFFTGWAAWSAGKAAKAASDTNKIASDTAERELRAYLVVEPDGVVQLIGSTRAIGMVVLRNVGKLPARNVQLIVRMERSKGPEYKEHNRRQRFSLPKPSVLSDRVVQPGGGMRQGSTQTIEVAELCEPHHSIYVFGIAVYDNGYGRACFTRFCHRYSTDSRDRKVKPNTLTMISKTFISADKARYHTSGNTAEEPKPT